MSDEKLIRFLKAADGARWSHVPSVWLEQLRTALNENLVKVGWGGIIELTETGKIAKRSLTEHRG